MGRLPTIQNTPQTCFNIFKLIGRLSAMSGHSTVYMKLFIPA